MGERGGGARKSCVDMEALSWLQLGGGSHLNRLIMRFVIQRNGEVEGEHDGEQRGPDSPSGHLGS